MGDFIVVIVGTIAMIIMVVSLLAFSFLYQKKINRKKEETREIQELLKSEELKSAYALLEGQDKERERMAQDLHDRMGGQLSTVKMYLDLLMKKGLNQEQAALVDKLQNAADNSIKEIRDTAHDLSNSTLKYYGLSKAVEHLCKVINDSKKISIHFHSSIHYDIPGIIARDLYQMIQELITNTIRHANAKNIRIELTSVEGEVNVMYEDNGRGFNTEIVKQGMGTKTLELRVHKHQGTIQVESNSIIGTSYVIEIPLINEN